MISTLRHSMDVRSAARVGRSLRSALRWWFPNGWEAIREALGGQRVVPSNSTLKRARVQLDVAAMLARRKWYADEGPTYRYLSYDASPQRGVEVFVTVERVVTRAAVRRVANGQWPATMESRLLPLAMLGSARMGVADKTHAHVHQVWLEYGPSVSGVRAANMDVWQ